MYMQVEYWVHLIFVSFARINIYYYNSNWITSSWQARIISNETQSVEFDLVIRACQRDVIRIFGSSYCYNDKFIIYLSNVIEINILDQLFNVYLQIKNTFKKELSLINLIL